MRAARRHSRTSSFRRTFASGRRIRAATTTIRSRPSRGSFFTRNTADAAKLKALQDFVTYGLTDGQKFAGELGYIPLPAAVVEKSKAALASIQ